MAVCPPIGQHCACRPPRCEPFSFHIHIQLQCVPVWRKPLELDDQLLRRIYWSQGRWHGGDQIIRARKYNRGRNIANRLKLCDRAPFAVTLICLRNRRWYRNDVVRNDRWINILYTNLYEHCAGEHDLNVKIKKVREFLGKKFPLNLRGKWPKSSLLYLSLHKWGSTKNFRFFKS